MPPSWNTEVLLASGSHPCPFFFHKGSLSPQLPDNGLHNSYLLWMEIKLSSMQFLTLNFLGNLRWSFPTELNFINPEKYSLQSTFCTWGRGKWPLCVCLDIASSWDSGQLWIWPGPRSPIEGPPVPPHRRQLHPDSGKLVPHGCRKTGSNHTTKTNVIYAWEWDQQSHQNVTVSSLGGWLIHCGFVSSLTVILLLPLENDSFHWHNQKIVD